MNDLNECIELVKREQITFQLSACLVVLGRSAPRSPPLTKRAATVTKGIAQLDSTKYPNKTLPMMAPKREAASVIAIPVALKHTPVQFCFSISNILML